MYIGVTKCTTVKKSSTCLCVVRGNITGDTREGGSGNLPDFWSFYANNRHSWNYQQAFYDWAKNSRYVKDLFGYTQRQNTKESNQIQIDYNNYMKAGNQRAYDDWQRLYGSKGLKIRYPELSYPGAIRGYDAGISRAYLSNDSADANYFANLPFRGAGLYAVASRLTRTL